MSKLDTRLETFRVWSYKLLMQLFELASSFAAELFKSDTQFCHYKITSLFCCCYSSFFSLFFSLSIATTHYFPHSFTPPYTSVRGKLNDRYKADVCGAANLFFEAASVRFATTNVFRGSSDRELRQRICYGSDCVSYFACSQQNSPGPHLFLARFDISI